MDETFALPVLASRVPEAILKNSDQPLTESFTRMIVARAKGFLVDEGEVAPIANVLGFHPGDRSIVMHYGIPLSAFLEDDAGKEVLAVLMPEVLKRFHAFCVVVTTEAWMLKGKVGMTYEQMQAEYRRFACLADHPDSVEVVNVMIETRTTSSMESYPIQRDADGKATGLGEDTVGGGAGYKQVAGRFANWLEPVPEDLH